MIRLVRVSYGTPRPALRHASMHLPRGTVGLVVGPMGAGKSVLLRLCACDLLPDDGSVFVAGVDTRDMGGRTRQRIRQATGLITTGIPLLRARTSLDSIVAPMQRRGMRWTRAVRCALSALDQLDALNLARIAPAELSAGERNLVTMARAVALRPPLVLADEPLAFLSPHRAATAMAVCADLASRGSTVLIVTSSDEHAPRDARTWRLRDGSLGPYEVASRVCCGQTSAVVRALLNDRGQT